jgi:RNA polymerase sigma-70 factor (ECF subfamily)
VRLDRNVHPLFEWINQSEYAENLAIWHMTTTSMSLLKRLRSPAHADWQRFADLYTPLLFFWARQQGMSQHDAEDLVQDVFAVLVDKMPEFEYDPSRSFRSWLRTVVVNKWRDRQRRILRAPAMGELSENEMASEEDSAWDELEYRRQIVGRAMELIEPEFEPTTWRAFWESAVRHRAPGDVASELGLTRNAVYVARSRVLKKLRAELEGLLE